jgi:hypothetical protein
MSSRLKMMVRPILRPIPCLRAVARMTASLTGNIVPERSQALLYDGQLSIGSPVSTPSSLTLTFRSVAAARATAAPIAVLVGSRVTTFLFVLFQVDLAASIDLHTAFGRRAP